MAKLSAAAALEEQKETIARSVTGLLYAEMPWLHDRYGERGRAKCLQDLRYHVEYLVPAVEMEAPETFAGYAEWCDGVLRARGVPTAELLRSLELMESDVAVRLRGEEAAAAVEALRGRAFMDDPELAERLGADLTARDAAEAAERLMERFAA